MLGVIRIVLLVFVIILLLYLLNPQVECWVNDRYLGFQEQYENMSNFLKDTHYNIPDEHRKSSMSVKEYYQQRDSLLNKQLVEQYSLNKHFRQGGVILDGVSTYLPPFCEWKNGMVFFAPEHKKNVSTKSDKEKINPNKSDKTSSDT